ncbi:hypothetical protein OVA03_11470 [Asticcacaulis sp. SL142]|uniref:NtrZ family periplasmic regulatory protein n=1 Tax=Asticcacaulis sp. SL142 TaxID=2995155 RepID=UPI00226CC554|nr:hypothetical protein [Asticcacaulis sp. SL142]WAC47322.1 hypothetical protein OVA03_11470 [Asticcacaulis sp. SL142]
MKWFGQILAGVAVLALAGSAMPALAQGKSVKPSASTQVSGLSEATLALASNVTTEPAASPASNFNKPQSKSIQLNGRGRWGVQVDVSEQPVRPSGWNDVEAGAFYKVNPKLRVGGSVGFGEKTNALKPVTKQQQDAEDKPRVRLETRFKF